MWYLLNDAVTTTATEGQSPWSSYIFLGIIVVFFVVTMVISNRNQKKRQQKVQDMIDALKPGDKIKTIGGVIGSIVEVCDDNAFVIETGSATKKSYIKFDKSAIYASADSTSAKKEDTEKAEQKKEVYNETVKEED